MFDNILSEVENVKFKLEHNTIKGLESDPLGHKKRSLNLNLTRLTRES